MRLLYALLILLLTVAPGWASKSLTFSASGANLSTTLVRYMFLNGHFVGSSYSGFQSPWAPTGNFIQLSVKLSAAPGAGASYTIELFKGTGVPPFGAGASVESIVVADTATSNVKTISVAAALNDYFYYKITPSGGTAPVAARCYISMVFDSTTAKQSNIYFGSSNLAVDGSTQYFAGGGPTAVEANMDQYQFIAPCNGTLKNLFIGLSGAPGAGVNGWHFKVMKGLVETAMLLDVEGTNTYGSDDVNTVSVVSGDLISIRAISYGTPVARAVTSAVFIFEAETEGDFPIWLAAGTATIRTDAALRYNILTSPSLLTFPDGEGYSQYEWRFKRLCFMTTVAPGGTAYYKTTLYSGVTSADTIHSTTEARVTGSATYAETTPATPITIEAGRFTALGVISNGSPTAAGGAMSVCGNAAPLGIAAMSGVATPAAINAVTSPSAHCGVTP